jgi:anthranilate synthase/aminodeoxychorismate synthase-like glutamine amidotransferase
LVHYFEEIGQKVKVFRNDEIETKEIFQLKPDFLVISPGPSSPKNSGICLDLIRENASKRNIVPTLGVCLGHQVIAESFNAKVIQSGKPVHGKVSKIFHKNSILFDGIKSPFNATRYHSLIIDEKTIPKNIKITAKTNQNVIMGIEHKKLPIFGVQFHPESIATENGHRLLENFLKCKGNL